MVHPTTRPLSDPLDRAFAAYTCESERVDFPFWFRAGGLDQPANTSEVVEVDGLEYVVLENAYGILAVYGISTSGRLKRLKRWPKEIRDRDIQYWCRCGNELVASVWDLLTGKVTSCGQCQDADA